MHRNHSLTLGIVSAAVALCGMCRLGAAAEDPVRIAGGHQWAFALVENMLESFCQEQGIKEETFVSEKWSDRGCVDRFVRGGADILLHYAMTDIKYLPGSAGSAGACERFVIGQAKAAVVVNARNPRLQMTIAGVRNELRIATATENQKRMSYYGESKWGAISSHIIRRACMLADGDYCGRFYEFRMDENICQSAKDIIANVARRADGTGTILWEGNRLPPGVKVLQIGNTDNGPFVAPSIEPAIQEDYPLSEYVVLYLRPNAPKVAREFCVFAAGEKGSKIAVAEGLTTPHGQWQYEADRRLQAAKVR